MRNNSLSVTKRIGLFLAAAFCIALIGSKASAQVPITYYDFENNVTRTTFENAVEQQINSGNSTLTKVGAPTTISGGTGAGIALHNTTGATAGTAASATTWSAVTTDPGTAATTYYQFTINTTGFTGTSLSYDEIAGTTAASFPCTGAIISTNGGGTFSSLIAGTCGTNNTWRTKSIALPAAADNNANVVIRVYGYFSDGTAAGTLALDNVTVFATTATAGTKTLLDEGSLFTSITSGATGSLFIRTNFTVNGASITTFNTGPATLAEVFNGTLAVTSGTFTLAGSISANLAATAVTVSSGATLSCGTAANIISGAGSFTLNSGGNLSISSANGITSGTTAAGNIQVTGGRTYNAAANYTYIRNATGAQVTGNGLPTSLTGNLTSNLGASADNPLTLTQSTTVAGTTTVSTKTFDLGANTLTTNGNTTISSGAAMTVNNGAILKNAGTVTTTGTLTFNNGGKYQHNFTTTGGTIPTATWNTGSTCEIIGYTSNSATPGGLGQSFYNFTWNSPSQTGNISAGGGFTTANGTLTIQTTGTGSFRLAASTSPTVNISGDLVVNGGTFIFSTGAGVPIVNVIGNVTLGGGTLQPATSTGVPVFNVAGNWSNNGGTFTPGTGTVNFNSTTATQTIGGTASTQTFNSITVSKSGQTLNIGGSTTALIISNALNVNAGTFDQGASANLTSGPITVASGATFQSLGTGDLTLSGNVSNSGTITLNANGNTCGQADDILIRSSVNGTQRSWSGAGTFNMTDVDVKDQAGTASILVRNGTNSGNNGANWVFFAGCTGAPYTWNGTTLADWNVGTNWTPTRLAPDPGDILTINGTSTPSPTLTNVPTQTIAALRLINGASATLQTNGANTLTINGATGSDLSVPSGNTLILDGSNALRLSVASGSNGVIGGQVIVQGGAHRVIGNAANAITFQSGALFTTGAGFTGNAFGAGGGDGATGSVIFASGSAYFHNAGSSPFGNSANPAVAVFQTGSLATFLTGSGFEASGRTYADLAIGSVDPGGIAVTASDSGTGNFQFDNLTVNSNTAGNSSLSFTGSGSSTVTIRGNITSVDGTGTLSDVTLSGGTGGIVINKPGGGTLTFGTSGNSKAMTFDSSASVASNTTLTLARKLIVGTITPSSFVLSVDINGALNGSATGYVIGKLLKNFSPSLTANTYQVGTVNGYSPVDVNNASGTGSLTINATQDFQPTISDTTKALQRYWTLSNIGLAQADLVFHYLDGDVPGTATESNFQVFKIDPGPTRTNMGGTINTGANTATVTGVTSFSDWTLAEPASISPTIVRLTGFDAVA
ncbi:MAG TPA: hypothetical protein VK619_19640, partial [Pyrinomonadaceae bacterium]|nr:hypothetical protein [Pyrinomonadaceae bacterium]